MANIVIVTADKTHAAVTRITNLLTGAGHTVTAENDSDPTVAELLTYDCVYTTRTSNTTSAMDNVVSAVSQGLPLFSSLSTTQTSGANTTEISVRLNITGYVYSWDNEDDLSTYPLGYTVNDKSCDSELMYPNHLGQNVTCYNNVAITGYSSESDITDDVVLISHIAGQSETSVNSWYIDADGLNKSGNPVGAKCVFNSLSAGFADFTTIQQDAILLAIDWLTSPTVYVSGVTTLDGNPISQRVVAVTADINNLKVLGSAISDPSDGSYSIPIHYQGEVMVFTLQDYGSAWEASTALSVDDYIHPTVPNGYIYKVTVAGTTGGSEPSWPTEEGETIVNGGVTFIAEMLLEPQIGGYRKPVIEV